MRRRLPELHLSRTFERAKDIAIVGSITSLIGMTMSQEWLRDGSYALLAGAPLGVVATKTIAGAGERLGLSEGKALFLGSIVSSAAGVGVAEGLQHFDAIDAHQTVAWEVGTAVGTFDGVMQRAQELEDARQKYRPPYVGSADY